MEKYKLNLNFEVKQLSGKVIALMPGVTLLSKGLAEILLMQPSNGVPVMKLKGYLEDMYHKGEIEADSTDLKMIEGELEKLDLSVSIAAAVKEAFDLARNSSEEEA